MGRGGVAGPFKQALRTFTKGHATPLVAGAFSKINEEFDNVLKLCAKMSVARGNPIFDSSVFEIDVKGGAASVTLHMYRRAVTETLARALPP